MITEPTKTGDSRLDSFLTAVYKAIVSLEKSAAVSAKPASGWALSDFESDVSEVISDKRELIDIVTEYGRSVDLIKALSDQNEVIDEAAGLVQTAGGYAEKFTQVQEWWDQNYPMIIEVERLLVLMEQIEPLNQQSSQLLTDMQATKLAVEDLEIRARNSATAAKTSQDKAGASATAAETAKQTATAASQSAEASKKAAFDSAKEAQVAEYNAQEDRTEVERLQVLVTTDAQNAAQRATDALNSANAAKSSETKAKTSETNAASSAAAALTSKNAAATSAQAAKTSENLTLASENNIRNMKSEVTSSYTSFQQLVAASQPMIDDFAGQKAYYDEVKRVTTESATNAGSAATRAETAAANIEGAATAAASAEVNKLIKGAPAAYDTFAEVAARMQAGEEAAAALANTVATKANKTDLNAYVKTTTYNPKISSIDSTITGMKQAVAALTDKINNRKAFFVGEGPPPSSIPDAVIGDVWYDTVGRKIYIITGV